MDIDAVLLQSFGKRQCRHVPCALVRGTELQSAPALQQVHPRKQFPIAHLVALHLLFGRAGSGVGDFCQHMLAPAVNRRLEARLARVRLEIARGFAGTEGGFARSAHLFVLPLKWRRHPVEFEEVFELPSRQRFIHVIFQFIFDWLPSVSDERLQRLFDNGRQGLRLA